MTPLIKICGIRTTEALEAAVDAGADMVGLVRFSPSPRHVELRLGRELSELARGRAARVLLLVDPEDRDVDEAMQAIDPDFVQLHGHETPERVAAIRARTGRPVLKALGIAGPGDLAEMETYDGAADRILLDARPPLGATLPGGNGVSFDWSLLAGLDARRHVMLSGGLDPRNVGEAIARTGVRAVDVSSGVETRPGDKDPDKIKAFIEAARAAIAAAQDRTAP